MNLKPQAIYHFLLFCLLLSAFCTLSAQNTEIPSYIEITGSAQIEVIPNEINVQIALKEYFDGKFKVTVSEQEMKMRNMLKIAGVDLSKLNLVSENANFVTVTKKSRDATTEKIFTLTISSAPMLTSIFQILNDLNIKEARVISVAHSQLDSLRQVVKIKALQNAKAQAGAMVKAIGNKLGKPLIIRDIDVIFLTNDEEYIIEDEYVLKLKKFKIERSVFTRFAIE